MLSYERGVENYLVTGTSGSSPDFHLHFNCLFLRYPIKTEEMECLILNKNIVETGKESALQGGHFWTQILEKTCLDLLLYSNKEQGSHRCALRTVSCPGCELLKWGKHFMSLPQARSLSLLLTDKTIVYQPKIHICLT